MFANTQMAGLDYAYPDICITVPEFIPVPFVNEGPHVLGVPTQFETTILCMPAHNLTTVLSATEGDEGIGIESGGCMLDDTHVTFVTNVLMGGPPATKMLNETVQNLDNCAGMTILPDQPLVLMLQ